MRECDAEYETFPSCKRQGMLSVRDSSGWTGRHPGSEICIVACTVQAVFHVPGHGYNSRYQRERITYVHVTSRTSISYVRGSSILSESDYIHMKARCVFIMLSVLCARNCLVHHFCWNLSYFLTDVHAPFTDYTTLRPWRPEWRPLPRPNPTGIKGIAQLDTQSLAVSHLYVEWKYL